MRPPHAGGGSTRRSIRESTAALRPCLMPADCDSSSRPGRTMREGTADSKRKLKGRRRVTSRGTSSCEAAHHGAGPSGKPTR